MKASRVSLLIIVTVAAAVTFSPVSPRPSRAQTGQSSSPRCCGTKYPIAPREVDFPYYNLTDGWVSTLNLVSDSPQAMDFTLAIKGKLGQVLTTPQTIQPRANLAIDLGSLITQLGGDTTGAFAEGSAAVYFTGTIMPLVGQITMRNPALSLVHESVMVEHDPGGSDIPAELDGLWWGIGSRGARVMISNTSTSPQTADVYLDFQGQRHPLPSPITFLPYETKTLQISELLASLGVSPAQAPEGGISIIQRGAQPALIANGRIIDAATGFSSTIDFPWTAMQKTNISALHASGLPIGTPSADSPFAGAGSFVPHVIVRNLVGTPQTVSITVEYPLPQAHAASSTAAAPAKSAAAPTHGRFIPAPPVPGDADHHPEWGHGTGSTVGTVTLGPFPVPAYSSVDYSLVSAMAQLPSPLPYCSVRIQYSGMPGSMQAQATSVEAKSNLIVDSHVQSEGNGWAGSGANPWHLDDDTESILFLTNESDKPAHMGFSITANDVPYYLSRLVLNPHETRAIDIRKLRDAQVPDFRKHLIPAGATDGSVRWLRLNSVPVMGRLMVINRHAGMASNYDCCVCPCPANYNFSTVMYVTAINYSGDLAVGDQEEWLAYGDYSGCNSNGWDDYWIEVYSPWMWTIDNQSVATVDENGVVTGVGAGTANITATYSDCVEWDPDGYQCYCTDTQTGNGWDTLTVADGTPVIDSVNPSWWAPGQVNTVTLTGSHFGTNTPGISVSGILLDGQPTVTNHSDTQIVFTVAVDANDPGNTGSLTVTSNGYDANGFIAMPNGGSQQGSNAKNPTALHATISVKTSGALDPSDANQFPSYDCPSQPTGGPYTCSGGWYYHAEIKGTVNDYISNWTPSQVATGSYTLCYTNIGCSSGPVNRPNDYNSTFATTPGPQLWFYIDGPGINTAIGLVSGTVNYSIRTKLSQGTTSACVNWHVKVVLDSSNNGPVLDTTQSTFGVDNYSCQ